MKRLQVVGAGITGLLTALKLHKDYEITMIDLGNDPRMSQNLSGATYSGLDARHISFTETTPWTSQVRLDLIMKPSAEGGWLCIPKNKLTNFDKEWISQFKRAADNNKLHKENTLKVVELNKKGIEEWEKLAKEYDFLKPITDEIVMPIICRSKEDLLSEFDFESSLDSRCKLYENDKNNLDTTGYFTLYGKSYLIKTLSINLINYLESQGVNFRWNESYSKGKTDIIVWCSGVSPQASGILKRFNILFGGVVGCWVLVDNQGITEACKIYGPEPINYLNLTPYEDKLFISGGYGFVGTRIYSEAILLAQPIMEAMIRELKNWFPKVEIKEKAFCIRPATPTGVPILKRENLDTTPIIFAVGHCAGGFTQAPYTANEVAKEVSYLD